MKNFEVVVTFASDEIIRDSMFFSPNSKIFNIRSAIEAFVDKQYNIVGTLTFEANDIIDAAHKAWEMTQNIHNSWNKENPCRSSCVGDMFTIKDINSNEVRTLIIRSFGFFDPTNNVSIE